MKMVFHVRQIHPKDGISMWSEPIREGIGLTSVIGIAMRPFR